MDLQVTPSGSLPENAYVQKLTILSRELESGLAEYKRQHQSIVQKRQEKLLDDESAKSQLNRLLQIFSAKVQVIKQQTVILQMKIVQQHDQSRYNDILRRVRG